MNFNRPDAHGHPLVALIVNKNYKGTHYWVDRKRDTVVIASITLEAFRYVYDIQ